MEGVRELAWAVDRGGSLPTQISEEFGDLVDEVESVWSALFPLRLGYRTRTEAVDEHAIRLTVSRGDFQGQVELACDFKRERDVLIRAMAAAHSRRELEALAAGERTIRRARRLATSCGGLIGVGLASMAWASSAAQMPVIGGLMLTVIFSSLLIGGLSIGGRIGEGLALRRRALVERDVGRDLDVQADIKRWNSLNRQLRGHRRTLARGHRGAPFRREA